MPHHSQLHPDLPEGIESRQGDRRDQEDDRRARGLTHGRQEDRSRNEGASATSAVANIQIYRPQLTSVLSIANRITGVVLSIGAVALVIWLSAAAAGPGPYVVVQQAIVSWFGLIVLFGLTFGFFLHLCSGIRHLIWDTVHGFELRSIYISGWSAVAASVVLTVAAWAAGLFVGGRR